VSWEGRLQLRYARDGERTVAHDRHEGPLRVLQSLYPEGPGLCHHVLVHPPGGIVGGDRLWVDVDVGEAAHALITTPGATRFYRSAGDVAQQQVLLRLAPRARLEWLPLETLAYSGCNAENSVCFELAEGAQMIGWDLLALGLPAADQPFERGSYLQALEWPGRWLERGRIDADDRLLLDSPLGLAGRRVVGALWFAAGTALPAALRDALLEAARDCVARHPPLAAQAGATAPRDGLVVLRVLAARVEPAMALLREVWQRWRAVAWQMDAAVPRVWRT
jgi:urease accessory protein